MYASTGIWPRATLSRGRLVAPDIGDAGTCHPGWLFCGLRAAAVALLDIVLDDHFEIVGDLGQVAEGINTLKLLKQESDALGVYMPLVSALYDVIYNRKSIADAVGTMMFAEQNRDVEY